MKKDVLWVIIVILTLMVGLLFGYVLGRNSLVDIDNELPTPNNMANEEVNEEYTHSVVGSYTTNTWNGETAVLVIKPDGTCHYPTGKTGMWSQDDMIISIYLADSVQTAEIVPNGILLHGHFFEKVS